MTFQDGNFAIGRSAISAFFNIYVVGKVEGLVDLSRAYIILYGLADHSSTLSFVS